MPFKRRGALVETADQVEQQLPAGLREGEIAEFVEDHEVEACEIIGKPSLAACTTQTNEEGRIVSLRMRAAWSPSARH